MSDPADTMAFCVDLIDRQRVALAPGETFGPAGAGAVRLSPAAAEHDIVTGLGRLADHVGDGRRQDQKRMARRNS